MVSYIVENEYIHIVKDILDEYEFPYTIQGNVVFADKSIEIILEAEGIPYIRN